MTISAFNEQLRRIVISGRIREESAAQFLEQITALEYINYKTPITIYIDTYGGNVDSGLLIYDAMKICHCPLRTIGIGKVMSMGVLLLAAGDKGNRYLTSNSRVMIHEISSGTQGTVSEMDRDIEEGKKRNDLLISLMAKHVGQPKAKLKKDMSKDFFMSAQEAIKYGIADKIHPIRRIKKKK